MFVSPVSSNNPDTRSSTPAPRLVETYTVPGLFAQVNSVLGLARSAGGCGVLNVTFDPNDGHVRVFRYDRFEITDEEFLLTTSALTPEP